MPRFARLVIAGLPHHIAQRGNNRAPVFFTAQDYERYLALLKQHSQRFRLSILGYCLMPNHVHLVAIPETEEALRLCVGRTHWHYAQEFNRAHGSSGHLWQNRFYSCPLDARHGWLAVRYVERNPVRAGMAKRAWEYRWSSAAAHVAGRDATGVLDMKAWRAYGGAQKWQAVLTGPEDEKSVALLRQRTATGWALAGPSGVKKMEAELGRRVQPLPGGRPPKQAT
jgi:putative transposase